LPVGTARRLHGGGRCFAYLLDVNHPLALGSSVRRHLAQIDAARVSAEIELDPIGSG
jgi:hypothetical protein